MGVISPGGGNFVTGELVKRAGAAAGDGKFEIAVVTVAVGVLTG